MGLDIYHYKATLIRPENLHPVSENYITESSFEEEGFDVDFSHFKDCIQIIDVPVTLKTIICPKEESAIEYVTEFLGKYEDTQIMFDPDLANLPKLVEEYKEKNELKESQLHRWETPLWIGFDIVAFEQQTGFYFEEVGYQRKGVSSHFWTRFKSETVYCFTNKEDFDFACSCVEINERKRLFQECFVDQFEAGKSWMELNY